jgi:hypothetical protein
VRAAVGGARGLCERCWLRLAGKNRVAASGGGSGERRDRRLGEAEAQRGPLGRSGGKGVLGLGYMCLVGSNVFMGFISEGTLG